MQGIKQVVRVVICGCLFSFSSFAAPIMFTYSGTGSGSVGSLSFANSPFTITAMGDTSAREERGLGMGLEYSIGHISAAISIQGVGTYEFTSSTRTWVNNYLQFAGFSRSDSFGLIYISTNSAFGSWSMLSGVGPATAMAGLQDWGGRYPPVLTDGGALIFNDSTCLITLEATLVPEPACGVLVMCGAALCYGRRFWRQRR
jgi:hypothetical protein